MPQSQIEPYFRYWGKTAGKNHPSSASCHLLVYHCLDVAATGRLLLRQKIDWSVPLADRLGIDRNHFIDWFVYCLALHDIGKFARSFQSLAALATEHLVPPDRRFTYDRKHDALGAAIWHEYVRNQSSTFNSLTPTDPLALIDLDEGLGLWMSAFFGHHGKPVEIGSQSLDFDFLSADQEAAVDFASALDSLFDPAWPIQKLRDRNWCASRLAPTTWQIAGIAVLADWIGSNADYFGYCDQPMSLETYWHDHALPHAQRALEATGLLQSARVRPFPGFNSAFNLSPTPLQAWADSVELTAGPQLFMLEDVTGAGKTEAALTLVHRLLANNQGNGVYFALPTMATSNAMYERVGGHYRTLYAANATPSLVLAHGARQLSEVFTHSVVPEPNADRAYSRDDTSAGIECRAWLADSRKKALLAEVGVGTVDQALLGVLPRKHQALRLLGLATKILVVDEVHAYDTYTSKLLQILLSAHAAAGGSAILLSATMPLRLRRDFIATWRAGRDQGQDSRSINDQFPLATQLTDAGCHEQPVASRQSSHRNLPVAFVHDVDTAVQQIVDAANTGQCVCWIRNTVDDASQAYDAVREAADAAASVTLFHARFTMADRQRIENQTLATFGKNSGATERWGQVLIATQVVEQSLDLDFDVLVSDLAPIDLLIQRAGRLHRHARDASGTRLAANDANDTREPPVLRILAPEWTDKPDADWIKRLLPGTHAVYASPARLWRTCQILRAEGGIHLPDRARILLEAVYSDQAEIPDGLQMAESEFDAQQSVNGSMAKFNALRLDQGYGSTGDGAGWSNDQEIGTRLNNEATKRVALVAEREGTLEPRHNETEHPWAMSTLTLREGLAQRLPELPTHLSAQVEQLCERSPWMRYLQFWLPDDDEITYDGEFGARIPRKSGNNQVT